MVAVDGTSVYFVGGQAVYACKKGDCADTLRVLATGQAPTSLAINSAAVYWTNWGPHSNDGSVVTCAKNGCNGAPTVLAGGQSYPGLAAADDSGVYWHESATIWGCAASGCGGAPAAISTNVTTLDGTNLAVDSKNVYWGVADEIGIPKGGGIVKCAKTGCGSSPTPIVANQAFAGATSLVVDSSNVYWTTFTTDSPLADPWEGFVMKCPLSGCATPTTIWSQSVAAENLGPWGIAVDPVNVYWVNQIGPGFVQGYGGGTVMEARLQ
jgi:hypothetical protein